MAGRVPFSNAAAGAIRTTPARVGGVLVSASGVATVSLYNGADNTTPPIYQGEFAAAGTSEYVDLIEGVDCTAIFCECTAGATGVVYTL